MTIKSPSPIAAGTKKNRQDGRCGCRMPFDGHSDATFDGQPEVSMRRLYPQVPRLLAALIATGTMACNSGDLTVGPSRSPGGTLMTAAGTGSLILDENVLGFAPLPGVSVTVTAAGNRANDVLIETDGGIQVNSLAADAVCVTDVAIFIDGAQVGPGRRVLVSNTPDVLYNVGTYGFSLAADLAPGTHTISVRAKAFAALAAVPCYVSSGTAGSDLPGRPHLQAVLNVVTF